MPSAVTEAGPTELTLKQRHWSKADRCVFVRVISVWPAFPGPLFPWPAFPTPETPKFVALALDSSLGDLV